MFGYTEEELLRLGVKDIHPKESLDYVRAEFEAQMRNEKILVSDLPCLRKNGTLFFADIRSTLIVLDGIKCNVGFFIDITERKLAEKELINARDRAEESDRLKTAFLHNISHEIRTPMNAIVGFSALLGEPDVDAQTRQSYIEVIMQSSNHLLEIISDIVDISNIEANLVKNVKNGINILSITSSAIPEPLSITLIITLPLPSRLASKSILASFLLLTAWIEFNIRLIRTCSINSESAINSKLCGSIVA
jgi:signal transduction histidine kinase